MLGGKEFETVGVCMGSSASSTTTVGPVAVGVVVDGCARRDVVSFTSSYVIDGLARDNLLFCVSSVSPMSDAARCSPCPVSRASLKQQ